ncbi:hypothetical protein HELRODRAFT_90524, partial [Helobdella robusta]|uniref:G-protein coupled receptors family 1 profile domain-containing protein n=1 Tax=Helobdella robusta TaxID=6412 RepID=T1G7S6_HELRO
AVIFGISFFGNFLVVFTMIMDNRWNSAISLFLLSLAVADLIFIIICLPYEFASRHAFNWTGPSWMCKMASFVEMLVACTSVLNLVAVSIERSVVIVHPIKSKLWCSRGRTHRIIGFMWLAAALLSSPTIPLMVSCD